ncbi:MAG: hypothetical protein J1E34_06095, partial [Oscillospiraceae bacterium]|nr:hypothetical protein [Oscillospiraceae bacterium]
MKVLKKPLSVLLSLMMLLGMISMLGSVSFAAVDNSKLLAQFFANKNDYWGLWNDNALRSTLDSQWLNGGQGDISYNHDLRMAYLDKVALQINTENGNLFDGVNRNTGVTFAFNYRPNFTGNHRHILSIGKNAYGSGVASHFFISGSTAHNSSGHFPIVEWVNEAGTETIKAYPQDVVPVVGREYNIVIKVDKDDGIIFYIDGIQQTTVYVDGENLNDVRAFLDEVSTYTKNYIGCSRWTDDAKIEGYLSDFRIYGSSMTDAEACSLVADMAVFNPADNPYAAPENAPFFDFSKPTFNAIGYFCDEEAVGGYNNLAYSSRQVNYKGTDLSNSYGVSGINFKIITSQNTIMVYDGVSGHEPAAPIEVETKVDSKKDRVINYIASADSNLTLVQDWKGRIDYQWTWWVPNHTNDGSYVNESFSYYNGGSASPIQDNTGTSRFWWNKLQYNGGMNENTYLLAVINPKFDISAKYNSTSNTGSIESVANYYILNYKPVYDVLTNAASEYSAMAESKWMYTEESYLQAMLAMRRLTLCSPSYCDYKSADISLEAEARANAIEQAITSYKNINLVKKQAKVNINVGEGTSITVTYNDGTIKTVTDGTYVDYGNVLNVTAAALEGYDQNSPVVT